MRGNIGLSPCFQLNICAERLGKASDAIPEGRAMGRYGAGSADEN